jgi:hypothetical protein
MSELFDTLWRFLGYVFTGIGEANRLNPRVFELVAETPWSNWVIFVIAVLGGASLLIGQSVILFVNRVQPARFALSLLINGVVFALSLVSWAAAIWLVSRILGSPMPFGPVVRMVGLGAAPYIWGFLVLIPWAGPLIGRVLAVWSLLVVLAGLMQLYQTSFLTTLLGVGSGWLLITLLTYTLGRPIIALRNRLFRRVSGTALDARVTDLLADFARDDRASSDRSVQR